MVSIATQDACVDFPIFDAKSRSLKKTVIGMVGGNIATDDRKVPVIEALRDIDSDARARRPGRPGRAQRRRQVHAAAAAVGHLRADPRAAPTSQGRVAPVFDLGVGMDPEISGLGEHHHPRAVPRA